MAAGSFTDAAWNENTAATRLTIGRDTRQRAAPDASAPSSFASVPVTTAPTPTTDVPDTTPRVAPVVALDVPQSVDTAKSVSATGAVIESRVSAVRGPQTSTITIRNSDGSTITVVHEPTLVQTDFEVSRGTSLSVSGEGYALGTSIDLWLHSDPVLLGRVTTDSDGAFMTDALIVEDAELGPHTLQVEGTASNGVGQSTFLGLRVLARDLSVALPATGSSPAVQVPLFAMILGLLVLAGARRRA